MKSLGLIFRILLIVFFLDGCKGRAVERLLVSCWFGSIFGCLGNCYAGSLPKREEETGMVHCGCRRSCDDRIASMEGEFALERKRPAEA